MTALVITLYIVGAFISLGAAGSVVARAVKHGPTVGGFDALIADLLEPRKAWISFAAIAVGVAISTTASILSLAL